MYWTNATEKIKTEWEDIIVGFRREEGRGCGENSLVRDAEERAMNENKFVNVGLCAFQRKGYMRRQSSWKNNDERWVHPNIKKKQTESRPQW